MAGLPAVAQRAKDGGDIAFDRFAKLQTLPGWETAGRFIDIRSKTTNANDNFANDNFEFAPVAKAAIA